MGAPWALASTSADGSVVLLNNEPLDGSDRRFLVVYRDGRPPISRPTTGSSFKLDQAGEQVITESFGGNGDLVTELTDVATGDVSNLAIGTARLVAPVFGPDGTHIASSSIPAADGLFQNGFPLRAPFVTRLADGSTRRLGPEGNPLALLDDGSVLVEVASAANWFASARNVGAVVRVDPAGAATVVYEAPRCWQGRCVPISLLNVSASLDGRYVRFTVYVDGGPQAVAVVELATGVVSTVTEGLGLGFVTLIPFPRQSWSADGRAGTFTFLSPISDDYLWELGDPGPALTAPLTSVPDDLDATAPTVPAAIRTTLNPVTSAVAITWSRSADDTLVRYYLLYRDGVEIVRINADSPACCNLYVDSDRPPGTYRYQVRAGDAAGNLSPLSVAASAVVPGDTVAPPAPTDLVARPNLRRAFGVSAFDLSWDFDSEAHPGAVLFAVDIDGVPATSTRSGTAGIVYPPDGLFHELTVRAVDPAGNSSPPSAPVRVQFFDVRTTPAAAPSAPSGFTATATAEGVELSWDRPSDAEQIGFYRVFRRDQLLTDTPLVIDTEWGRLRIVDTTAVPGATYRYQIAAFSRIGVYSPRSAVVRVAFGPPDTTSPGPPAIASWESGSAGGIQLRWSRSIDNVGVTGYLVHRNAEFIAFATVGFEELVTFVDTAAPADQVLRYQIRAVDRAGNFSAPSPTLRTALGDSGAALADGTLVSTDRVAPSAPGPVAVRRVDGGIEASWAPASDNVIVAEYWVHVGGRPFRDTFIEGTFAGSTPGARRVFFVPLGAADPIPLVVVRARDLAGNTSAATAAVP